MMDRMTTTMMMLPCPISRKSTELRIRYDRYRLVIS